MKSLNDMTKEEQQSPELFRDEVLERIANQEAQKAGALDCLADANEKLVETIDLENEISEEGAWELGSSPEELSKSWMGPYYRLAKRLGIEGPYYDPDTGLLLQPKFAQLNEAARDWLKSEIIPTFDPELSSLFNSLSYSIHWDQLATMVNDLHLKGETVSKVNESISHYLRSWARFVWTMENFVHEKLLALGFDDIRQQEQIISAAFQERSRYVSIDDLLADTIERLKEEPRKITVGTAYKRDKALATIPQSYTMAVQDNQLVTPVLGLRKGDDGIKLLFKETKFNGETLPAWHLKIKKIEEDEEVITEADLAVAFAACEVAKNNQVTDFTGRFHQDSFTIPEVVALMFKVRGNNIKPGSVYYKFVEDSIHKLMSHRYKYDASELATERGVSIPDGFLLASENAPLLDCTAVKISKAGKAIDAFILSGSFVFSIIQMLGTRNTITMWAEFMPTNVRSKTPIVLTFEMLSKACNKGLYSNKINTVYLSGKGRPGKYALFKAMASEGWTDSEADGIKADANMRKQESRQRQLTEETLDRLKKTGCFTMTKNPDKSDRKLTHYYLRLDRTKEPLNAKLLK